MESEHTHLKPCFCRQRLDVLFVRLFGLSKLIVGLFAQRRIALVSSALARSRLPA
jgi:hypothetical protein